MNHFYTNCSVYVIDSRTDSIQQLQDYIGTHNHGNLEIIKVFSKGTTLFLCTSDNRIFKYEESLKLYAVLKDIKKMVATTENGEIIYLDTNGLNILDINDDSKLLVPLDILDNYDAIMTSRKGEIFLTAEKADSVSLYEYTDSNLEFISTLESDLFIHSVSRPNKIERYGQNLLLIWNRLFEIKEDGKIIEVELARAKRLISEYIVGRSGLGYAATDLGIYILNTARNRFEHLASNNDSLNSVRAFYSDPNFSIYKEGVEKIEGYSTRYDLSFLENIDLGFLAYQHYQDPINIDHIWTVGLLDDCYIRRIDLGRQKIECFDRVPSSTDSPNQILRSAESNILYISSAGRPSYLDEIGKVLRPLVLDCLGNNNMLTNHLIEKNGEIWFAASEGVIQYNEKNKSCTLKNIFPASKSYIIQYMHEDKNDPAFVWLGTRHGGLVKWDTRTDSLQIFNTDNGLSNNDVHAIIEDNSERLWIPTNKNLNTFDKKNNSIFHFTEADGLSHSEFNKFSYFYDTHQEKVYFGGLNGYNYFNPDSISTSQNDNIELRIIDVKKIDRNGKPEDVYTKTLNTNSISILEEDVSIQIELATNYLLNPDETKYSYRIPGLLDDWRTESTNVINLNRLPYGKYEIEFIADMNKLSSMSDILSIDLRVIVPWWKTWAFYLFSILGTICLIGLLVRRYNKKILERNTNLEKMVSLRTEELQEVLKTKNKIFTILAHDLRNPISGLSNLSEKVRFLISKDRYSDLDHIAQETDKRVKALNDNLSNILIWAVSENSTLSIQPRPLSLGIEIEKVLQLYTHEVEKKNLEINLDIIAEDKVFMDLTILQTLLRNYIHNSIKFSQVDGIINISLSTLDKNNSELKIEDFGIGMSTTELNDTSDNNQEIRNKGKGLGLGMMISQELAEKAAIDINIVSEVGRGTVIQLILPKSQD